MIVGPQGPSDFQHGERLGVGAGHLVVGFVSRLSQSMEPIGGLIAERAFIAELVDDLDLAGVRLQGGVGEGGHLAGQHFSELAELDERGVRVLGEVALGLLGQLVKHGAVGL